MVFRGRAEVLGCVEEWKGELCYPFLILLYFWLADADTSYVHLIVLLRSGFLSLFFVLLPFSARPAFRWHVRSSTFDAPYVLFPDVTGKREEGGLGSAWLGLAWFGLVCLARRFYVLIFYILERSGLSCDPCSMHRLPCGAVGISRLGFAFLY